MIWLFISTCNWVCIDPISGIYQNTICVQLGYSTLIEGWIIPDKRKGDRILEIFERDYETVN